MRYLNIQLVIYIVLPAIQRYLQLLSRPQYSIKLILLNPLVYITYRIAFNNRLLLIRASVSPIPTAYIISLYALQSITLRRSLLKQGYLILVIVTLLGFGIHAYRSNIVIVIDLGPSSLVTSINNTPKYQVGNTINLA